MQQRPKISVVGSVNVDFVIRTHTLPMPGQTIGNGRFETLPGGKGANVAVAARRLGCDVALWACVGDDPHADMALQMAQSEGVALENVRRLADHRTGIAFINVADDGENQIALAPGANHAFEPAHLVGLEADAIVAQFEIPETVIIQAFRATAAFKCLNASPVGPALWPFLPFTDLVILNEGEFEHYAEDLREFSGLIAVTLGKRGARLIQSGATLAAALPPAVDVVDTTGAGDSFAAALVTALVERLAYADALKFACAVGALTTTRQGTQAATPYRAEIDLAL